MLVYTNSIRHRCMIHSLHSLPRIECTLSHSSRRNIWRSSRSSRTCSGRWPAPKPPFCSGSCRHNRSGILKNSRPNRTGSRKASIRPCGCGSCRHRLSCRLKNRAKDNRFRSRSFPNLRPTGRSSRYICPRKKRPIPSAAKYSWKSCIYIRSCRRRTDIFRRSWLLVRPDLTRS